MGYMNAARRVASRCCFHAGRVSRTSAKTARSSALGSLRRRTGFSLVNCRRALEQFGDLDQAEKWLQKQAQKEGWEKARKLQGRSMSQGLVAVLTKNRTATMIEVNCETDFVARNAKFQDLVSRLTTVCHNFFMDSLEQKIHLATVELNKIPADDEKKISDIIALEMGNIGENMALRRAAFFRVPKPSILGFYVHSSNVNSSGNYITGRYGALVELRPHGPYSETGEELGLQIAQHIVGMNPHVIGKENDEPNESKDEESKLIFQEFLLDSSMTVVEVLSENNMDVVDFVRFECGEELSCEQEQQKPADCSSVL